MVILPKNKNFKLCPIVTTLAAVLVLSIIFIGSGYQKTSALSRACAASEECVEAARAEQKAIENANYASKTANLYQIKVQELNVQIAIKESEIYATEAEVAELNRQIKEAETKLLSEQRALASLLAKMHFSGDSEPIRILAGSSSISDLAEKQAREEAAKKQITISAATVKEAKEKLESDRENVKRLLAEQKAARNELAAARAEQQELVNKYQNDAESYAQVAEEAKAAKLEAERREQEAHPELYRGSSFTGENTYPWQNDCPHRQDDYVTYWEDFYGWHKIGGLVCECVSYVGWKAYERFGLSLGWGNAYSWDDVGRRLGYRVDHTPAEDTIGQADGGQWGHVFWVEGVNADGSINVTEYNNAYATQLYSGQYRYGDFGSRRISANELWQYNFIHLE